MKSVNTLESFTVGEMVAYIPDFGLPEIGEVTSINDHYVFVRYGDQVVSKATRPFDLWKHGLES